MRDEDLLGVVRWRERECGGSKREMKESVFDGPVYYYFYLCDLEHLVSGVDDMIKSVDGGGWKVI
jgi:hypothetical protein